MTKIPLTFEQLLVFVLHGLKVGNVGAVINLVEEYCEALKDDREKREADAEGE